MSVNAPGDDLHASLPAASPSFFSDSSVQSAFDALGLTVEESSDRQLRFRFPETCDLGEVTGSVTRFNDGFTIILNALGVIPIQSKVTEQEVLSTLTIEAIQRVCQREQERIGLHPTDPAPYSKTRRLNFVQ
ncbi:MAG: hypothetical protein WCS85_03040 [Candidatus Peribacteraceae bacterium]